MRNIQRFLMTAVAMVAMGALNGCAASAGYYARVPLPPPPPGAVYARGYAPGPGYVYRDGYYNWSGRSYVWIGGGWVLPPRPRAVWIAPGWHGRRWRGGYWR
jgi:WXXGXW repeat (2 copies)